MHQEKKVHEVQIGGFPLKLKSSHDKETVDELTRLVDEKIQEALAAGQNVSYQKALLLASLHIAEDYLFLKKSALSELDGLEDKAKDILSDLEASPVSRVRLDN